MAIELVRIDDRLIHGQVVTTWVKQSNIEQILIINDEIASDEIQKSVFDLMAPDGVVVRTFGVSKFIEISQKTEIKRRTLLLLTKPEDALELIKSGIRFKHLNLGGMKYGPKRKRYTKSISLTDKEKIDLDEIGKLGVTVSVQMIPTDKEIKLQELLEMEGK